MGDLATLDIKESYDSGYDDILYDFYIPVLSESNQYDRISGFFSSGSLALAARGMQKFLENGGTMRLVTCPRFSRKDAAMLEQASGGINDAVLSGFISDYESIEDEFERDHVKALGWMLAKGKLDIRIAIIHKDGHILDSDEIEKTGIMHQKVGVMFDSAGNRLSFSGSNNESASGWLGNTEEFKVFCSWQSPVLGSFIDSDENRFLQFWEGRRHDVRVMTLPEAVKEKLIEISSDFEPSRLSAARYRQRREAYRHRRPLEPFWYQAEAIRKWEENGRQLLLEMATGTGKTRTAFGCIRQAIKDTPKLAVIIATPQPTLSSQWKHDAAGLELGIENELEVNGDVPGWDMKLKQAFLEVSTGVRQHLVVYTTHTIASMKKYLMIMDGISSRVTFFLVGDEVHGMGAEKMREALTDRYAFRLGLSATPQRWFDDMGSRIIREYFGNESYAFTIRQALDEVNEATGMTFLVNYIYHPRFVTLTEAEIEQYGELTEKIRRQQFLRSEEDAYKWLEFLNYARADIGKSAVNKYRELETILQELGSGIRDTIIFVSHEQKDRVMRILGSHGISAALFTQEQGTAPMAKYGGKSEREHIIELFRQQRYQVLVAIKCLDEGIDIPSAEQAVIMASSTNPREYVQRIGRIIRQAPGKTRAVIYDMIVKPDLSRIDTDLQRQLEEQIFRKEMDRAVDISRNAINNVDAYLTVSRVLEEVTKKNR